MWFLKGTLQKTAIFLSWGDVWITATFIGKIATFVREMTEKNVNFFFFWKPVTFGRECQKNYNFYLWGSKNSDLCWNLSRKKWCFLHINSIINDYFYQRRVRKRQFLLGNSPKMAIFEGQQSKNGNFWRVTAQKWQFLLKNIRKDGLFCQGNSDLCLRRVRKTAIFVGNSRKNVFLPRNSRKMTIFAGKHSEKWGLFAVEHSEKQRILSRFFGNASANFFF